MIQDLKQKLDKPWAPKTQRRMKPADQKDPLRKVFKVNTQVFNSFTQMNQKLLQILTRSDFDRPILMCDKLDQIWESGNDPKVMQKMVDK